MRRLAGLPESRAFIRSKGSDGRVAQTREAAPSFKVKCPPFSARSEYLQVKTDECKPVSFIFSLFLNIPLPEDPLCSCDPRQPDHIMGKHNWDGGQGTRLCLHEAAGAWGLPPGLLSPGAHPHLRFGKDASLQRGMDRWMDGHSERERSGV